VAVSGLINVPELRRVWALSRMEFSIAMAAFAAVLLLGILKGVIVATVFSMLLLIHRAAHPHVAQLGRVPATRRFSDLARHPDNETVSGVLIVRAESSLLYFNVTHVRDQVRRHVATAGNELRLVVWDLSTSPFVDIAGTRLLGDMQRTLALRGVSLRVVEAHSSVRALIRQEVGLSVGEVSRRISIDDVIADAAVPLVDPPPKREEPIERSRGAET
jgi:MFS superfamily sulfate permease-like transporter